MAHVHFPFQVEEVSLLLITMVYDRQSPAKTKGREKEKQLGHPSLQLTSEEIFYKSIFLFLFKKRNICLKMFSMIISLIHFEISFLLQSHSCKNLTNKAFHKAGSTRRTSLVNCWDCCYGRGTGIKSSYNVSAMMHVGDHNRWW